MAVPETHSLFLERIIATLKQDDRLLGVAIAGSYLSGTMDEYSDIDLVIVVDEERYEQVMQDRQAIANRNGHLLAAFTGEHVGEPRLLICLYDNPLMHVDLKFVHLQAFKSDRIEDPIILWERENLLTQAVRENPLTYRAISLQWIEDRFWVWVHYLATKLGRGELFEAIDFLAFLRGQVLAPLAKVEARRPPRGVRLLEQELPHYLADFCQTLPAQHDVDEISRAIEHAIDFYQRLRESHATRLRACGKPNLILRTEAENASTQYLKTVVNRSASKRNLGEV